MATSTTTTETVELTLEDGTRARVVVIRKDTTGSTMDDMRDYVAAAATPFPADLAAAVVVARTQTAGRGTGTRTWASATPGNLYCNIALPLARVPAWQRARYPLVLAVALRRVLGAPAVPLRTKWPNDLVAPDGRKVAGTLAECAGGVLSAGVGVNIVAAPALRAPGARPAAALADLVGTAVRLPAPDTLALALCRELLGLAHSAGGGGEEEEERQRAALLAEYRAGVDWGVPVCERAAPTVPLVALGVTDDGLLRVRRPDGTTDVLVDSYLV